MALSIHSTPSPEFLELAESNNPEVRQTVHDILIQGLRYQQITEGLLVRCTTLNIPFETIRQEIVRQLDEMPSKEFH